MHPPFKPCAPAVRPGRMAAAHRGANPYTACRMGDTAGTSNLVRILVIEDDPDIREVVKLHLQKEQFAVVTARDGSQGLAMAGKQAFALVILDLGLPGIDGLQLCRQLAALTPRPLILILTARSGEVDRVQGLDRGADDYVVKPFSMLELGARVRALLRRPPLGLEQHDALHERTLMAGSLLVDRWERCARIGVKRIDLTSKEFDLLLWFARHPLRVFTRAELLDAVWGTGYEGYEHTVNSHLNRLRAKIEGPGARPVIGAGGGGGLTTVGPPPSKPRPGGAPAPPAATES